MPYKNVPSSYSTSVVYHVYARGVNKMDIFLNDSDYTYFLFLLKKYLTKNFKESIVKFGAKNEVTPSSVYGEVKLLEYCLMNNHFHLLLENVKNDGVTKLMRRILSNYVKYFNHKYSRQGPLIQGGFRAVPVRDERQFITVGIYIHINPLKDGLVEKIQNYPYSSYKYYFENKKAKWLEVSKLIKENTDYKNMERYFNKETAMFNNLVEYQNRL
ncbi:transposase [Patescibacteria group bacterium]|nr:transposase [Patescibacteria group bacterium]